MKRQRKQEILREQMEKQEQRQARERRKPQRQLLKQAGRLLPFLIVASLTFGMCESGTVSSAASKYITAESFARMVLQVCDIETEKGESALKKAQKCGIVTEMIEDGRYITRADAALLLEGAYEKVVGKWPEELIRAADQYKRLSDVAEYDENRRQAMIRLYAAGIIPGYKGGDYAPDREFRGNKKLTKEAAEVYLGRITGEEPVREISPDGQLIRTEKLPVYAEKYPYILANYPNAYYDWNLRFENARQYKNGEMQREDYEYPAEVDKMICFEESFARSAGEYAKEWTDKVRAYAQLAFQVDYRTIAKDETWKKAMYVLDADSCAEGNHEGLNTRLERYIAEMQKNKTVIELETAAADPSSMYYFNGKFYIRLYVKYRIVSSIVREPSIEEIIMKKSFNSILFGDGVVSLNDIILGEWREGYYDIGLSSPNQNTDGNDIGISERMLQDDYYIGTAVKR